MSRIFITTDPEDIDFLWLYQTLANEYWGWEYTMEKIEENARAALSFGVYERYDITMPGDDLPIDSGVRQLGFARVVTDKVSISLICDVVVDPRCRNKGIGSMLMEAIVRHPDVKKTISILGTKKAWCFYERHGFKAPAQPMMQRDPL